MSRSSEAPFHAGLTPAKVVEAAVDLTRHTHLMSWSIRDLASRLGVSPSVIYHHVGGKDLLCRHVVEQVAEHLVIPSPELDWQDWFREFLFAMGPLTMEYPGSAKWMMMHGPTVQAVLPALEAGFDTLARAGFGAASHQAFATLVNTGIMAVAMGDDRLQHEEDGPRDHAAMIRDFERIASQHPVAADFSNAMMHPFAVGGEAARRSRVAYFRFAVEITIAGLETWLADGCPTFDDPSATKENTP